MMLVIVIRCVDLLDVGTMNLVFPWPGEALKYPHYVSCSFNYAAARAKPLKLLANWNMMALS